MSESKVSTAKLTTMISDLTQKCEHKVLAIWAADCAERVFPVFDAQFQHDVRVRNAIDAARAWVSGTLAMPDTRKAAFAAHAAAREAENAPDSQASARAAGHAAATAHVKTHAIHAANYAAKAVRLATHEDEDREVNRERMWQYGYLLKLSES